MYCTVVHGVNRRLHIHIQFKNNCDGRDSKLTPPWRPSRSRRTQTTRRTSEKPSDQRAGPRAERAGGRTLSSMSTSDRVSCSIFTCTTASDYVCAPWSAQRGCVRRRGGGTYIGGARGRRPDVHRRVARAGRRGLPLRAPPAARAVVALPELGAGAERVPRVERGEERVCVHCEVEGVSGWGDRAGVERAGRTYKRR